MSLTWGDFRWGKAYFSGEYLPTMIVDRTQSDVYNATEKAYYNATDLNRVETGVEYIAKLLTDNGYFTTVTVKKDWIKNEFPTTTDMNRYISNIQKCVDSFTSAGYEIPTTIDCINYLSANNIENTLESIEILVNYMIEVMRYSGTFYIGNNEGLRGYSL